MHIGSVAVFEPGPLGNADGGIDIDRVRGLMEAGIHKMPALPPAARPRAGLRPSGLGGRRAVQPRLPRAPHASAATRRRAAAEASRRSPHVAAARSGQAALGDVGDRGTGRRSLRHHHEGPPLPDRRGRQRRADGVGDATDTRAGSEPRPGATPLAAPPGSRRDAAPRERGLPPDRMADDAAPHPGTGGARAARDGGAHGSRSDRRRSRLSARGSHRRRRPPSTSRSDRTGGSTGPPSTWRSFGRSAVDSVVP